jgi:uncharacterized protein with PQ loop repeat
MNSNLHHISKRKRFFDLHLEEYPSKKFWIRFLDKLLLIVAAVSPFMAVPQIFQIYSTQSSGDLSLFTWSMFAFFNIPWMIYGIAHKEKPIIIAYILWFIMNSSVVVGILLYS